jgi:methylase of polypeptide subunit release factors
VTMSRAVRHGVDELRGYLDHVGFAQLYKFIAGVNLYGVTPSVVTWSSARNIEHFFDTVLGDCRDLRLLQCLMSGRPAERDELSDIEKRVADALVAAELLRQKHDTIFAREHQLISAFGIDLLIDRRIHFGPGIHDVYIGPDSYWMLYYVDAAAIRREHRVVDLCSGSGVGALYLSLFSEHVLATDIGGVPLSLIEINRRLNRREESVKIRNEDLRDTLDGRERFDVVICNPPFVAYPEGLRATLYSHGTGADGLGYLRDIIERAPAVMTPGGSVYLVADLVGDGDGPHFIAELEEYAAAGSLAIDVYVDNVVPAGVQVEPLAAYLEQLNDGRDRVEIATELEEFQRDTLRAERYYMTTLKVRTASATPGVRVLRRFVREKKRADEPWPSMLLQV